MNDPTPEGWKKRRSDISGRPCFDLALPLCEIASGAVERTLKRVLSSSALAFRCDGANASSVAGRNQQWDHVTKHRRAQRQTKSQMDDLREHKKLALRQAA
jgi:hypothetical protein